MAGSLFRSEPMSKGQVIYDGEGNESNDGNDGDGNDDNIMMIKILFCSEPTSKGQVIYDKDGTFTFSLHDHDDIMVIKIS